MPEVVAACLLLGAVISVVAERRLALVAGMLVAVAPAPLLAEPSVLSVGWVFATASHLVSALVAAYLLARAAGGPFLVARGRLVALAMATLALAVGGAAWIGWSADLLTDAGSEPTAPTWTEPGRWAFAAGAACLTAAVAQILASRDVLRIASGAALAAVGAFALASGVAAGTIEAMVLAVGAVPLAAASAGFALSRAVEA